MEAIFNAVNRPRPRVLGMNEKLIEFLRTKPPTFGGSVNPLDADDWLRAILRGLEPFNCEDRDKVLLAAHRNSLSLVGELLRGNQESLRHHLG
jgi:hypothetical protein